MPLTTRARVHVDDIHGTAEDARARRERHRRGTLAGHCPLSRRVRRRYFSLLHMSAMATLPHGSLPVLLAHGASGTAALMRPHVDGLRVRGGDAPDAQAVDAGAHKGGRARGTV